MHIYISILLQAHTLSLELCIQGVAEGGLPRVLSVPGGRRRDSTANIIQFNIPYDTVLHRPVPDRTVPCHRIASHRIASRRVASHRIASHGTTPHHATRHTTGQDTA